MREYSARVEFSNGEYHDITVMVVPIPNLIDNTEQFWIMFPTELYGLVTELYGDSFYSLTGFIRLLLLNEYRDVICVEISN